MHKEALEKKYLKTSFGEKKIHCFEEPSKEGDFCTGSKAVSWSNLETSQVAISKWIFFSKETLWGVGQKKNFGRQNYLAGGLKSCTK